MLLFNLAFAADPIPRDAPGDVRPVRYWDLEHVELDLKIYPEERRLEGRAIHHLSALYGHPHRIRLHQRGLNFTEVKVDGEVVTPTLGPTFIDIPTHSAHPVVELSYSASPEIGMHFRGPKWGDEAVEFWTQGEDEENRYWFPSWDYPSDTFTITSHLTVPSGLVARANGALTQKEPAGSGWTRWSFALEQPIANYLVAAVAGEYAVYPIEGPVPIEALARTSIPREQVLQGLDATGEMMVYFNDLLKTDYPFPVYRQVMVQRFLYGGMENASLTTLTEERRGDPSFPIRSQ